jgi:hypothetical protein
MIYLFTIDNENILTRGDYYIYDDGSIICIDDDKWFIFNLSSPDADYTSISESYTIDCKHEKQYIEIPDDLLYRDKQIKFVSNLLAVKIEKLIFDNI